MTDGESRSALAGCRGLADAGHSVAAYAARLPAPAHWSRSVDRRLSGPDPIDDPEGFLTCLERALYDREYAVLFTASDPAALLVSAARGRLDPFVRVALPPPDVMERCFDKVGLLTAAAEAGLPPPEARICTTAEQARNALADLGTPAIVKPSRSAWLENEILHHEGPAVVTRAAELDEPLARFPSTFIVQRYVGEPIHSVAGVIQDGRLRAAVCSRYRRTWPPEAGSAAFSEVIPLDRSLRASTEELLRLLGFSGLFELELVPVGHGRLGVIDLNPRLYGSLALALAAGVNLPAIACDLALGRDAEEAEARAGLRYRWEEADARHLVAQLGRRRFAAAASVLRPSRHVVHALFRLDDPGPLLARFVAGARAVARRLRR